MFILCEEDCQGLNQIYGWRFYDSMVKIRRVNCYLLYYLINFICDQDEFDDDSSRKINKMDRDKIQKVLFIEISFYG